MSQKRPKTSAAMTIQDSPRDSPRKKKVRTESITIKTSEPPKSPLFSSEVEVQQLNVNIDYLRNQMTILEKITKDDPIYDLTLQTVIAQLKKRPPIKAEIKQLENGGKRLVWDMSLDEDIDYRYEMIEIGNEIMIRCMYKALGRFIEMMNLRLAANVHTAPVLHIHNAGYVPLSLHGAQFSHHFFAYEYFTRILYTMDAFWKRRKVLSQQRSQILQSLPENPLDLRVEVMINIPSSTFGTEVQSIDVGTLQDILLAKPKYPQLKGGKKRRTKKVILV